ncbi:uncharacterized protein DUF3857 [Mucilaginibacter gracilis]|uniref:Uncharacterized protein DUF3857 n=1 Tax=Mucilaginibacter gracilis TaxID=423350 RepID=A0A495ITU9_9SPHI|nr:DUF3857 domain-containing protein [Mucilaginibacter gracilis]RKR80187.1 uncharacterized protein DUF3857 [Mucilaginibacter gracilis]
MTKLFTSLFLLLVFAANAQTIVTTSQSAQIPPNALQPYGKISMDDMTMKACDFEKDANAEVLFDKGTITSDGGVYIKKHVRIKIFNEAGKRVANFRIEYLSTLMEKQLSGLKAETLNLENGEIIASPLDKKSIYTETVDREHSAMVFPFPNVRAGSVIEVEFTFYVGGFPTWYFQREIPTRYSQIDTDLPTGVTFRAIPYVRQPFAKAVGGVDDFRQIRALANIPSLPDEPFMTSRQTNLQRLEYTLASRLNFTWQIVGNKYMEIPEFSSGLDKGLPQEKIIIDKAKSMASDNEKISYIFNTVKEHMRWNEKHAPFSFDGVSSAWNKQTGYSGEINMMVYHLLKKVGVKSFPMLVSTKNHGRVNVANPDAYIFNNMVVYLRVDSTRCYVLDASDKYGQFNEIPEDYLNHFGLKIDPDENHHDALFLEKKEPAIQSIFVNAEVNANGKMAGTTEISSTGRNKINAIKSYKTNGEEKYLTSLTNDYTGLKISSIKFEDMDVDTLPLKQKIAFEQELTGLAEGYLYFNINLFNLMGANPFMKENRVSDIDFGYRHNYTISGFYKLPNGYKLDALPKNVSVAIPDGTITFKRIVTEENGMVRVRMAVNHKQSLYFAENYAAIREFYKQMYSFLNEPVVLKKI